MQGLHGAGMRIRREAESDTIFEFLVDSASGTWRHWARSVPEWVYPRDDERPKFAQLVIPTLDSMRCVMQARPCCLARCQPRHMCTCRCRRGCHRC